MAMSGKLMSVPSVSEDGSLVGLFGGNRKAERDKSSKGWREDKRLSGVGRNERGKRRKVLLPIFESLSLSHAAHHALRPQSTPAHTQRPLNFPAHHEPN